MQVFGLMSVIASPDVKEQGYNSLMVWGVRLAAWNQILDPWVYILLRRTVLHKIYLITKCQVGLRRNMLGRWEPTPFHSSEKHRVNHT